MDKISLNTENSALPSLPLPSSAGALPSSSNGRSQTNNNATTKVEPDFFARLGRGAKAYGTSLLIMGVIVPIVASFITVVLYLARQTLASFTIGGLSLPSPVSPWVTLVDASILTGIVWLTVAIPLGAWSTAMGAHPRNYSLLRSRLHQLNVYLGITDYANRAYEEINELATVMRKAGFDEHNKYQWEVLKEAYACCLDVSRKLYRHSIGLSWILGTGYNSVWRLLHHAEEVLIEAMDAKAAVRQAKHDFLSIEGSQIEGKDELLHDVSQAVAVLQPEASTYFPEASAHFKEAKPSKEHTSDSDSVNSDTRAQADAAARVTLREVRSTLNDFRDKRWEALVRQRGRLLAAIALTGAVTYALLCVIILAAPPDILAASVFYLVGAIAGLFTRLYAESRGRHAVDDFGLSRMRLITTPLLSGLAAIGGVLVVGTAAAEGRLAVTSGSGPALPAPALADFFTLSLQLLLTAAIFGVTPNLLIKGLQKKANQYRAELQSSSAADRSEEVVVNKVKSEQVEM